MKIKSIFAMFFKPMGKTISKDLSKEEVIKGNL